MERLTIDRAEIEYEVRGDGEPIVLIHGGGFAEAFRPMAAQPNFAEYRTIRYHRRGHAGSTGEKPGSVDVHAADARAILEALGVGPAHIVGHSYGGSVALQLAVDAPELVGSLSLLEPGINFQMLDNSDALLQGVTSVIERYASGDHAGAVDLFLEGITGPDGKRMAIETMGEAAYAQFVADADDAFESDMPSLLAWTFGEAQAREIVQPALFVIGGESDVPMQKFLGSRGIDAGGFRMFGQVRDLLAAWMPHLEVVTLPGLTHALEFQDVKAVTTAVAGFIAKHPIAAAASG